MIPGKPKQAPKDPELTLMKIDPRYVMGNRPRRERDLLLFSINPLPVSVYNLNSSFPTRLPGYFQSLFQTIPHIPRHFYFSLFLYSTLIIA